MADEPIPQPQTPAPPPQTPEQSSQWVPPDVPDDSWSPPDTPDDQLTGQAVAQRASDFLAKHRAGEDSGLTNHEADFLEATKNIQQGQNLYAEAAKLTAKDALHFFTDAPDAIAKLKQRELEASNDQTTLEKGHKAVTELPMTIPKAWQGIKDWVSDRWNAKPVQGPPINDQDGLVGEKPAEGPQILPTELAQDIASGIKETPAVLPKFAAGLSDIASSIANSTLEAGADAIGQGPLKGQKRTPGDYPLLKSLQAGNNAMADYISGKVYETSNDYAKAMGYDPNNFGAQMLDFMPWLFQVPGMQFASAADIDKAINITGQYVARAQAGAALTAQKSAPLLKVGAGMAAVEGLKALGVPLTSGVSDLAGAIGGMLLPEGFFKSQAVADRVAATIANMKPEDLTALRVAMKDWPKGTELRDAMTRALHNQADKAESAASDLRTSLKPEADGKAPMVDRVNPDGSWMHDDDALPSDQKKIRDYMQRAKDLRARADIFSTRTNAEKVIQDTKLWAANTMAQGLQGVAVGSAFSGMTSPTGKADLGSGAVFGALMSGPLAPLAALHGMRYNQFQKGATALRMRGANVVNPAQLKGMHPDAIDFSLKMAGMADAMGTETEIVTPDKMRDVAGTADGVDTPWGWYDGQKIYINKDFPDAAAHEIVHPMQRIFGQLLQKTDPEAFQRFSDDYQRRAGTSGMTDLQLQQEREAEAGRKLLTETPIEGFYGGKRGLDIMHDAFRKIFKPSTTPEIDPVLKAPISPADVHAMREPFFKLGEMAAQEPPTKGTGIPSVEPQGPAGPIPIVQKGVPGSAERVVPPAPARPEIDPQIINDAVGAMQAMDEKPDVARQRVMAAIDDVRNANEPLNLENIVKRAFARNVRKPIPGEAPAQVPAAPESMPEGQQEMDLTAPERGIVGRYQLMPSGEPKAIKEAASKSKATGRIYTGLWHGESAFKALKYEQGKTKQSITDYFKTHPGLEDGFVTNDGTFVDRQEAAELAKAHRQIDPQSPKSLEAFDFNEQQGTRPKRLTPTDEELGDAGIHQAMPGGDQIPELAPDDQGGEELGPDNPGEDAARRAYEEYSQMLFANRMSPGHYSENDLHTAYQKAQDLTAESSYGKEFKQLMPSAHPDAIKEAAMRDDDTGKVHTGRWHFHALADLYAENPDSKNQTQGFVDNSGKFYTRAQAYDQAQKMGQKPEKAGFNVVGLPGTQLEASKFEHIQNQQPFMTMMMPSGDPRAVKEAAIKMPDGKVYTGYAHSKAWQSAFDDIKDSPKEVVKQFMNLFHQHHSTVGTNSPAVDGYVTGEGEFLDRDQAHDRAVELKQIKPKEFKQLESFEFNRENQAMPAGNKVIAPAIRTKDGYILKGRYASHRGGKLGFNTEGAEKGFVNNRGQFVPKELVNKDGTYDKEELYDYTGQAMPAPPKDSPEFKKWFKASKVVDDKGQPKVVFHGTTANINYFEPDKKGSMSGYPDAQLGYFFTENPKDAEYFAHLSAVTKAGHPDPIFGMMSDANPETDPFYFRGQNIVPTYLSLQNPRVLKPDQYRELFMAQPHTIKGLKALWEAAGHDGLVYDIPEGSSFLLGEGHDPSDINEGKIQPHPPSKVYVAFRENQIKSAIANNGKFSPHTGMISMMPAAPDSAEFKKWFGGSKITHPDRSPMVVFHTTRSQDDFDMFDPSRSKSLGIHFGTPDQANDIFSNAGHKGVDDQGNVPEGTQGMRTYPVFLKMKNPLRVNSDLGFTSADQVIGHLKTKGTTSEPVWKPEDDDVFLQHMHRLEDEANLPHLEELKDLIDQHTYKAHAAMNKIAESDATELAKYGMKKLFGQPNIELAEELLDYYKNYKPDPDKYKTAMEYRDATIKTKEVSADIAKALKTRNFNDWSKIKLNALQQVLEDKGYDGIIYPNQYEGRDKKGQTHMGRDHTGDSYAVFHPWQIKSAIANKDFDPVDPRLQAMPAGNPDRFYPEKRLGQHDAIIDRLTGKPSGVYEGPDIGDYDSGLPYHSAQEQADAENEDRPPLPPDWAGPHPDAFIPEVVRRHPDGSWGIEGPNDTIAGKFATPDEANRALEESHRNLYHPDEPMRLMPAGEDQIPSTTTPQFMPGTFRKIMERHNASGGSTTDLTTGKELQPQEGRYVYGTYPKATQVFNNLTPAKLRAFAEQNQDALDQPNTYLGTWENNGKHYVDISTATDDFVKAQRAAFAANQDAIWDNKFHKTVTVYPPPTRVGSPGMYDRMSVDPNYTPVQDNPDQINEATGANPDKRFYEQKPEVQQKLRDYYQQHGGAQYMPNGAIPVDRYGPKPNSLESRYPKATSVFFAAKGDAPMEMGDYLTSAELKPGTKLFEGDSSMQWAQKHELWDKFDPLVKEISGFNSLHELDDANSSGLDPSDVSKYYGAFQAIAARELAKQGYQGAHWAWEDELTPEQYQIWDHNAINMPGQMMPATWDQIAANLSPKELSTVRDSYRDKIVDAFNGLDKAKGVEYAKKGVAGKTWYRDAVNAIHGLFASDIPDYRQDPDRFATLLAALSPNRSVQDNLTHALSLWNAWDDAGRPTSMNKLDDLLLATGKGLGASGPRTYANNVARALTSDDPSSVELSGQKVAPFAQNLRGDVHAVTNDRHMGIYAYGEPEFSDRHSGDKRLPGATTLALTAHIRDVANHLTDITGESWTPSEVQAAIWTYQIPLQDLADSMHMTPEELLQTSFDVTPEQIDKTPSFAKLLQHEQYRPNIEQIRESRQQGASAEREPGAINRTKGRQGATSTEIPGLDPNRPF